MPTENQQGPCCCYNATQQTRQSRAMRDTAEGRSTGWFSAPLLPLCPVCHEQEAEHNSKERAFCDEAHRWPLNCPHCGTGYCGRHTGFCPLNDEN